MKSFRELREKTLTPAEKKKREEIAKAMEKDNPDMPMDKKMAIATATAKRVAEYGGPPISRKAYLKQKPMSKELDEGRMKELHGYIDRGMSAQQIAKKMKLDVKTIQALMPKKESIDEQKDDAEYNDEGGMAISQLKTAKSAVEELMSIIKDDDNLPEWVQSKLTKAVDYMDSVRDYMASEKGEVQEAVKTTHVVIDTADGNKIVATASSEQGAKSSVASAERPPISIKNKRTLKIVKLKKPVGDKQVDRMVGYPLKEGKYKVNIKGEGGATVQARSEKEAIAKVMKQLGIANRFAKDRSFMKKISVLGETVEESRAYRDAMRGMKGNTKGMATTKKDKDIEATDDDRKAASKNIIMQLRKAADLSTGANIEFERGKGKVDRATAQNVLAKFNRLQKPIDKERFQNSIKSLADIKKILGR